jgi:aryl-alcohol dehydrogenase-like predicted oxidoreductase
MNQNKTPAGYQAASLILGCSRLGSALTPLDRRQCLDLLHLAHDLGVRDFDTANIYGQGDSERFIGEAFRGRRSQVRIASKAGQRLSPAQRALALFKRPVRFLASRRQGMRTAVAHQRAGAMRFDFDAASIGRSLESSLRRLGTEYLDIFYLHSPPVATLNDDVLRRKLEELKAQGKFVKLGVSCDDSALAAVACDWVPADVVQFDVSDLPGGDMPGTLAKASAHGKTLLLRGTVRHGRPAAGSEHDLAALLIDRNIGGFVVGTTDKEHLRTNVEMIRWLQDLHRVQKVAA